MCPGVGDPLCKGQSELCIQVLLENAMASDGCWIYQRREWGMSQNMHPLALYVRQCMSAANLSEISRTAPAALKNMRIERNPPIEQSSTH